MLTQSFIDYFLAEKLKTNPDLIRKGRMVVLIFFFLAILMPIMAFSSSFTGDSNDFPFFFAFCLMVAALFIFKKTGLFYLSGHLLGFLVFSLLTPIAYRTGGLYSDDLLWLVMGPVMAFLVGNRWTGILWTLALIGVTTTFYLFEKNSPVSMLQESLILNPDYYFYSLALLFTMLLGILFIYENEKTKLIEAIGDKRNQLKVQNDQLEAMVKERTRSLEQSNAQLKSSNEDLEQFAYVASHDLQEPLRMVGNFVQLLEEEYKEKLDEDGKTYINYAVDGVSRMSLLIEELLQYSRVGKKEEQVSLVDLNELIEQKKSDLGLLINRKNVVVKTATLPSINCIRGQIGILFFNLINNGIKFNKSFKPIIEIGCREEDTHWVFSVKDNGIGIPGAYQKQIFELFKRLHRKEEYSGTGIGLAVCKKIVEQHKGKIWLESEEGEGTTFFFSIFKNLQKEE